MKQVQYTGTFTLHWITKRLHIHLNVYQLITGVQGVSPLATGLAKTVNLSFVNVQDLKHFIKKREFNKFISSFYFAHKKLILL